MAVIKAFKIEMTGGGEVKKDIDNIKSAMDAAAKSIKAAKAELNTLLNTGGDSAAVSGLEKKILSLEKALKSLAVQKKAAETDDKRAAQAAKLLADARLKEAQAEKVAAQAAQARSATMIAQEKELDRLTAKEERETKALQAQKQMLDALPGSYRAITAAQKQLRPFIQSGGAGGTTNFNGQNINFDQAIQEYKRLSEAEQNFRRQFTRDGLLVGEYASGIAQSFKNLGIDDILKKQVTGAKRSLGELENATKGLVVAYRQAQASGTGDLNKLEKEIHDNVVETQKLQKSIADAEISLKGMGGVGGQITGAINRNFKELKNSIAQFALGYVGFQAIFTGIQKTFSDTVALDSFNTALKNISGTESELAINQAFLAELTERLGIEYVGSANAFKSFYAASTLAGISADETRRIFASTAAATANLKLSQEDTNGVLLAFSQIASKGKVQAEELRGQIGERVPGAFAIAAKAIGVTQAELNKMLEQGQVIATDFLPKFAAELGKTFGGDTTKNVEGLQASINRLKNEFTKLLDDNREGLVSFFSFLVNAFKLLIASLPTIVTLLAAYAVGWTVANAQMIIQRGLLIAQNTLMPILIALTGGYANALKVQAFAANLANKAMGFLSKALGNPYFKVFAGVIGISAIALNSFGKSAEAASVSLGKAALKQQFLAEAQREANKSVAETLAKEQALLAIIKDRTLADETRQKALNDLKGIMGEYGKALTLENVLTAEGTKQLALFNAQLLERGRLTAANAIKDRENAKLSTLIQNQFDIENAIKNKGVINTGEISEDLLSAYYEATGRSASAIGAFLGKQVGVDFEYSGKDLKIFSDIIKKRIAAQLSKTTAAELAAQETQQGSTDLAKTPLASVYDVFQRLVNNGGTEKEFQDLLKRVQEQQKSTKLLSKEYKDLRALEEKIKNLIDPKKGSAGRSSRLTGGQKDLFKEIDAQRDQELADERRYFSTGLENEKNYLRETYSINAGAIDAKLALLKRRNAEEIKLEAELQLEKITLAQETNKKLFDLDNQVAENALRNVTRENQRQLAATETNPELSETGRVQAKENFLNEQLKAQIVFNQQQIALEKFYGIQSIDNEQRRKEAIEKINAELLENLQKFPEARARDIQNAADKQAAQYQAAIATRTIAILDSDMSYRKKAMALKKLESDETKILLANDVAALKRQVEENDKLLAKKLISEKQYQEKYAEYKRAEAALLKLTQNENLSNTEKLILAMKGLKDAFADNVLGIKSYTNDAAGEAEKMGDLIDQTLANVQTAITTAYDSYFKREESKIDQQTEINKGFLDRERERVLATAQSEDERASINRKFDKENEKLEKKAAERKKKLALKQLAIDFAVAAIKSFATFGWPLGLVAVAGLGLAYLAQRQAIQQQEFAEGGRVQPLKNGKINRSPNIKRKRNGDNVVATVKTGEVILNERQQKLLGGVHTFRRIGVPGFATGGAVGSQLGTQLRPPTFNSGFYSSGVNDNDTSQQMDELRTMVKELGGMIYAADAKQVVLNPHAVTGAQDRKRKDVSVATI